MEKFVPILLCSLLAACGGGGSSTSSDTSTTANSTSNTVASSSAGAGQPNARLLAAQCFQCHGMNGVSATGIESLAGINPAEFIQEMLEMKYSTKVDIMHYQAKGYSEADIRLMAGYFAALPKN